MSHRLAQCPPVPLPFWGLRFKTFALIYAELTWSHSPPRPSLGPLSSPSTVFCQDHCHSRPLSRPFHLPQTLSKGGVSCGSGEATWCVALTCHGLSSGSRDVEGTHGTNRVTAGRERKTRWIQTEWGCGTALGTIRPATSLLSAHHLFDKRFL